MAASLIPYAHLSRLMALGAFNLETDALYAALVASTYAPSVAHTTWQSGSGPKDHEITPTGNYPTGGILLSGVVVNATQFVSNTWVWANLTHSFRTVVLYKLGSGGGLTNPLIGYCDFGSILTVTAKDFRVNIPAAGLIALTQNTV